MWMCLGEYCVIINWVTMQAALVSVLFKPGRNPTSGPAANLYICASWFLRQKVWILSSGMSLRKCILIWDCPALRFCPPLPSPPHHLSTFSSCEHFCALKAFPRHCHGPAVSWPQQLTDVNFGSADRMDCSGRASLACPHSWGGQQD